MVQVFTDNLLSRHTLPVYTLTAICQRTCAVASEPILFDSCFKSALFPAIKCTHLSIHLVETLPLQSRCGMFPTPLEVLLCLFEVNPPYHWCPFCDSRLNLSFLKLMGSLRVRHDWATSLSLFTFMHWRRKWQPTPVFLPGESQGQGAWWAAVYAVAQSRTRLKRLSSSSKVDVNETMLYVRICVAFFPWTLWFGDLSELSSASVVCSFLFLMSILLERHTSVCLSSLWLMYVSTLERLWIKLLWTFMYSLCVNTCFFGVEWNWKSNGKCMFEY